jgi:hypothetical protein
MNRLDNIDVQNPPSNPFENIKSPIIKMALAIINSRGIFFS